VNDLLEPIKDQLRKLWERVALMPVIRWGTVTATDPVAVILDGDEEPLPFAPQIAVSGLTVGARVVCVEQHRRVIVIAAA